MVKADIAEVDGLTAGGSCRVPLIEFDVDGRGFGGGGAIDLVECPRGGGIRGIVTQSGSSVGV